MEEATLQDLLLERFLRLRESGDLVWTTKQGKSVPVKEMTDNHLQNTINMLLRQKEEEYFVLDHIGDYDPYEER